MYVPNKPRSRRLRKKLHIGEFQEMGFAFETNVDASLDLAVQESLLDAFLSEVVEPRSLALGGWITGGFIASYGPGSVAEADREAIRIWLTSRSEIKQVQIGPLVDAWYPAAEHR